MVAKKILVMGLPGSGKTFMAMHLQQQLDLCDWLNADLMRKAHNDWDFSYEGRIRQARRMTEAANISASPYIICDFVAPLPEMRTIFEPDWVVWMDTIDGSKFEDTNKAFVPPGNYDFHITEKNAQEWSYFIAKHIVDERRRPVFDWKKETVQLLGRWQPWHEGHRALFKRALVKTGQVVIQIRDCQGWKQSNPFAIEEVKRYIRRDLDPLYQGQYEIQVVPNIVNITYGRDVGYKIEQETFSEEIHSISATKIREKLYLG